MIEEWKIALIATVTGSDAFRSQNPQLQRRILRHLAEHSSREERYLRTEDYLKENFFAKNYSAKVSMFLLRLANMLEQYFASEEGHQHTHIIQVVRGRKIHPDDRYSIEFRLNQRALARRFWDPYLDRHVRTFIVYGVPLFVRSKDQRVFTRYADVNAPATVKRRKLSGEVAWPFVAHGDLLAAAELTRWFFEQDVPVDFAPFKATDPVSSLLKVTSEDANIIALGSTRVSGILDEYQQLPLRKTRHKTLPFRLRLYDVIRVDEHGKRVGLPHQEEQTGSVWSVPVIITRRGGLIRGSVTLVASNHGRAVARACQILTNETELCELFQDPRLQGWVAEIPTQFQILLRVEVFDNEDMGGAFSVEDVWRAD